MISIIIVNYNTHLDTINCIQSILNSKTSEDFKIIVVDNASTDESFNKLQRMREKVVLLKATENLGYCAGNNIGISYAINKLHSEYIWILNPDTLVESFTLQKLYNFSIAHKELGVLGCKLLYYPEVDIIQAFGGSDFGLTKRGELSHLGQKYHLANVKTLLPNEIKVDVIIGASMFIPTNVFKEIGMLDENYFLYSDESDFCLRALKNGFINYAISDAIVYHKEGWRSIKQNNIPFYYSQRNILYLVKKLYPYKLKYNLFFSFLRFFKLIFTGKFVDAKYLFMAIHDFLIGRMGKRF